MTEGSVDDNSVKPTLSNVYEIQRVPLKDQDDQESNVETDHLKRLSLVIKEPSIKHVL